MKLFKRKSKNTFEFILPKEKEFIYIRKCVVCGINEDESQYLASCNLSDSDILYVCGDCVSTNECIHFL